MKQLREANERLGIERNAQASAIRDDLAKCIQVVEEARLSTALTSDSARAAENSDRFRTMAESIHQLESHMSCAMSDKILMTLLYFPVIEVRYNAVSNAHHKTFQWILREPKPNSPGENKTTAATKFVEWLRGEKQPIFWVRGKAGSGKSTLMKYIVSQPETAKHLEAWAGDKQLVIAKHFFWSTGTSLQKSQEGLLRSILFEVLRKSPELRKAVRSTLPEDMSDELEFFSVPLTKNELFLAFSAIKCGSWSPKFCFFIDGLDEYKGEATELIKLIQDFSSAEHVKVCISSRPWTEFIDAFGQDEDHVIRVESLTRDDIRNYVFDRFGSTQHFQPHSATTAQYVEIANQIVERAQGVFLWVVLVVKSLLEGLTYADTIDDLRLRLDAFPPDLDAFFQQMLDSIPVIYRKQTTRIFQIALVLDQPHDFLVYSFLDDLRENPQAAFVKLESQKLPIEEYLRRLDQVRRRLDGRCKGLLEVSLRSKLVEDPYDRYNVTFLHRTVRDFLSQSENAKQIFKEDPSNELEVCVVLCHAQLLIIKSGIWVNGDELMRPAQRVQALSGYDKIRDLLLEAERIDEVDLLRAARFGLHEFIQDALRELPSDRSSRLAEFLASRCFLGNTSPEPLILKTLELLLNVAGSRKEYIDARVFYETVVLDDSFPRNCSEDTFEIMRLLLTRGIAIPRLKVGVIVSTPLAGCRTYEEIIRAKCTPERVAWLWAPSAGMFRRLQGLFGMITGAGT